MSYCVGADGVVYDYVTGVRIGVNVSGRYGYVLDEDEYRDDGRYETVEVGTMNEPVADVLTRVAQTTQRIGPLLLELLNEPDTTVQNTRLREAGRHLGELSAECLARAAEAESGRNVQVERVVIDAQSQR